MMHGIDDNAKSEFTSMCEWIEKNHPGTPTYPLALYEDAPASWTNLDVQVKHIAKHIREIATNNSYDAYHLVCHSQGGLICRALVEDMDDHKVHTLVSLAGPQMGVYGPGFFDFLQKIPLLRNITYEDISVVAYSVPGQLISVANMWNDPMHQGHFLSANNFLPLYNGLNDDATGNARRKANFLRLQKGVFLTGVGTKYSPADYDNGIEPARSGVFDFFKEGTRWSDQVYVPMKEQTIYTEDTFGLKTLNEAGKLITQAVHGIGHHTWVDNETVVEQYILPHLV
jgi:palmitoyl-protein thioesterase